LSNFDKAMGRILGIEGGYVNDPEDPGGETKYGISKRHYPNLDIKNLTRDQALALYLRDFWLPNKLDDQPFGVAYQMMDFAVNSGSPNATRAIQRAVGVADDGYVGPHTLAAIKATEPHDLVMRLIAQRLRFMTRCKNWAHDSGGWTERLAKNLEYGAEDV
jgi:lysozyme family protein